MKKLYELIGRITLVTLGIAIAFILMQKAMIYVIEVEDSMPLPKGQIEIQQRLAEQERQQERQKELEKYNQMSREEKLEYEQKINK